MDLRSWNIVVMAALLEPVYKWETMLLSNLPVFSSIYCGVLRSLGQSDAMADINHIFIALKLWVMLTRKASTEKIETMPITVWNELWSPFQAFVDGLELDGQTSVSIARISLYCSSNFPIVFHYTCNIVCG